MNLEGVAWGCEGRKGYLWICISRVLGWQVLLWIVVVGHLSPHLEREGGFVWCGHWKRGPWKIKMHDAARMGLKRRHFGSASKRTVLIKLSHLFSVWHQTFPLRVVFLLFARSTRKFFPRPFRNYLKSNNIHSYKKYL